MKKPFIHYCRPKCIHLQQKIPFFCLKGIVFVSADFYEKDYVAKYTPISVWVHIKTSLPQ